MYRQATAGPSQLFALEPAEGKRIVFGVMSGMAMVAVVGASSAVWNVEPNVLMIPCMIALAACAGGTVAWLARGPVSGLLVERGEVVLVGRNGKALDAGHLHELSCRPVIVAWHGMWLPAIAVDFPGRSVVVTTWRHDLGWTVAPSQATATHRLEVDGLWPSLVAALGLAEALPPAAVAGGVPQPPTGPPRRRFPVPALTLPGAALAIGGLVMVFEPVRPLAKSCLKASRCCLADAHAEVPVDTADVARCVRIATSPASECEAPDGAGDCDPWPADAVRNWKWDDVASEVPSSEARVDPIEKLYPRVSCKAAVERLLSASDSGSDGSWVAIRCSRLSTKTLTQKDPDGFIYCDGYPIPIVGSTMWSRELMREPEGPHAIFAQPRARGHYRVGGYCRGCNVVGKERSPHRR